MSRSRYENAKHEIELLKLDTDDCYDKLCYRSALKALKSLEGDNHSGYSIMVTKSILNRMIDGKPLSPITEENAEWQEDGPYHENDDVRHFRSGRYSAFFKDVYADGKARYTDVNRATSCDVSDPWSYFTSAGTMDVVDSLFPITMPYYPYDKKYVVYVHDIEEGLRQYLYVITPEGDKVELNKDGTKKLSEG